jgi:FkbM family methyltransferase
MAHLRARAIDVLRRLGVYQLLVPLYVLLVGARAVRPAPLFALREGMRRKGVFLYRVRSTDFRVAIRHGTSDTLVLSEVFHKHIYAPHGELAGVLARVDRIVDLGANIGLFGAFAAVHWPAAEILAFEPDPENAAVHRRTMAANGLADRWRLIEAAAADHEGRVTFVAGRASRSHIADAGESGATIEVPLVDALPYIAHADLLKMDIEGGEWAIIGSDRFREAPPKALVLEYHPHLCPGSDARAHAESVLKAAGLRVQSSWHGTEEGHGMLWAWRS